MDILYVIHLQINESLAFRNIFVFDNQVPGKVEQNDILVHENYLLEWLNLLFILFINVIVVLCLVLFNLLLFQNVLKLRMAFVSLILFT